MAGQGASRRSLWWLAPTIATYSRCLLVYYLKGCIVFAISPWKLECPQVVCNPNLDALLSTKHGSAVPQRSLLDASGAVDAPGAMILGLIGDYLTRRNGDFKACRAKAWYPAALESIKFAAWVAAALVWFAVAYRGEIVIDRR